MALLLVGIGISSSAGTAHAGSSDSPIATDALKYLGTHGGQCWTFMQRVVSETTGRTIVGDYRQAYLNAGAVEVSKDNAGSGDIIQIASDRNTAPWASYPGLHTAIILKNLGGGRFDSVDSNQNWDEMVRLRPDYDPYASASRYGLQVHLYHIPPGLAPAAIPHVPPTLAAGAPAIVDAQGDCLNLRSAASTSATKISCLPGGTPLTILGGPVNADGMTWVQVQSPVGAGWVAAQFLSAPPSTPAAPAATATPTAPASTLASTAPAATPGASEPTTAPSSAGTAATPATSGDNPPAAATPAASGDATPAAAPAGADAAPAPGVSAAAADLRLATIDGSPGCLRMRAEPSLSASISRCLDAATEVGMLDEAHVSVDGYEWAHIRVDGSDGWVAAQYLIPE